MKKRAVVTRIKTYGDEDMANQMAEALKPLTSAELETVKAEMAKVQAENAELGVRKPRDNKTFARKMRQLKRKYPPERKRTKVEDALLVGWAMMWLGIFAVAAKLRAINRER